MNPKVVEVYSKVGMLLSRYKSGPLPKAFKIIPTLRDWEEVLQITNPYEWTPQAVYQATRIFTSNLKAKMAQRFFSIILLDRVRCFSFYDSLLSLGPPRYSRYKKIELSFVYGYQEIAL